MRLTNGSEELKVRFCGIDAPELKQTGGNRIEGLFAIDFVDSQDIVTRLPQQINQAFSLGILINEQF
jgi:hypothetical protein